MARRKKLLHLSISHRSPELIERARALARREHRNFSAFVVNVLTEYVKAKANEKKRQGSPKPIDENVIAPRRAIQLPNGGSIIQYADGMSIHQKQNNESNNHQ